jgi:hypothetical protein
LVYIVAAPGKETDPTHLHWLGGGKTVFAG